MQLVKKVAMLVALTSSCDAVGQRNPSSAGIVGSTALLPDDDFLLQREFARLDTQIAEQRGQRRQLQSLMSAIESLVAKDEANTARLQKRLSQTYNDIKNKLALVAADEYWKQSDSSDFYGTTLRADLATLESLADKFISIPDRPIFADTYSYIQDQSYSSSGTVLSPVYGQLVLQLDSTFDLEDGLDALVKDLWQPSWWDPESVAPDPSDAGAVEAAKSKWSAYVTEVRDRLEKAHKQIMSLNPPDLNADFAAEDITGPLVAEIESLGSAIESSENRLAAVAAKVEDARRRSDSTFSSTNYMMLLLAFSFGLTVIARARYRQNESLITDQTLVEYGGMSFLILAVIILASGDRIQSDTVGPLLGTIAGYIFGRSVATHSSNSQAAGPRGQNGAPSPGRNNNEAAASQE